MNATQRTAVPPEAVNSLAACLRSQPTQDAWIDALSEVLDRHWPTILQMPPKEYDAALAEFFSTVEAARATAQLTPEQQLLDAALSVEMGAPATPELRDFYASLQFSYDEETQNVRVFDASGKPFRVTVQ
jgi:hypothetical protein